MTGSTRPRLRSEVEVFPCRRVDGWIALVWFISSRARRIYYVAGAKTADAATAAAEVWAERLRDEAKRELTL